MWFDLFVSVSMAKHFIEAENKCQTTFFSFPQKWA